MENTGIYHSDSSQTVKYAGFWWRFLAYLIDEIVMSFILSIIFVPAFAIMGISMWAIVEGNVQPEHEEIVAGSMALVGLFTGATAVIIQWLYFAIMESSKSQGTLGKLALRIKVTDYSGNRVSFGRATGRYFGKIVSSFILLIGYIMAGFTAKKQALHDMMAGCLVIKD
ncbi:MAG TPA: RDD family protein [Bacteroidales bacterium]|nr:RDD family protein [Bacteroidales bacterium]HRX96308.1 RDD family protein [Bacteroidales bacterium]